MTGPDPSDLGLLRDSPEDADKPAIKLVVPDHEAVKLRVPVKSHDEPRGGAGLVDLPPAAIQQQSLRGGGEVSGTPTDDIKAIEGRLVEEAVKRRGPQPFEMLRQRHQDALDASLRLSRMAMVEVVEKRLEEYNQVLEKPCYFEQRM